MKPVILRSKKFTLRFLKKGDERAITKHANNRKISRMMFALPHPYTLRDAKKWIARAAQQHRKRDPVMLPFVIEVGGEVVGMITLHLRRPKDHKAEVGYWLGEQYWNQGITTAALKLVTKFGFEKLKLRRLFVRTYSFNKPSQKVAENAGYRFEGILRKDFQKNGRLIDTHLFAKVR